MSRPVKAIRCLTCLGRRPTRLLSWSELIPATHFALTFQGGFSGTTASVYIAASRPGGVLGWPMTETVFKTFHSLEYLSCVRILGIHLACKRHLTFQGGFSGTTASVYIAASRPGGQTPLELGMAFAGKVYPKDSNARQGEALRHRDPTAKGSSANMMEGYYKVLGWPMTETVFKTFHSLEYLFRFTTNSIPSRQHFQNQPRLCVQSILKTTETGYASSESNSRSRIGEALRHRDPTAKGSSANMMEGYYKVLGWPMTQPRLCVQSILKTTETGYASSESNSRRVQTHGAGS
jgi:hypothetical protein